ncbi:neprilysin-1-like isoform X2 [Stegodyphus dumicola]|uniref:neprilysin-1-like isoform X2 n=1 Tax=Stegodyphus dumicola TaxID=202533 RepID=UPI0015AB9E14|nr:neprilysin-1-like isoform X2 [Stegodyphus dumicola]
MTMALKGTHSPNGHTDNLPEYEMLANGNPGKKPELDPKKTVVRIQENPLAELNTEKPPLPNDMVQLRIEKGESRCGSRFRAGYRTTFELFLSLTIAVLGLTCCALFYMIFLQAGRPSLNICLTQECVKTGLLEEPANNHDNSATIKAKTFYKSCISTAQIDAIGDKPLRDVVKELGGWPVAERDWVEPEWPLEHLLGQLRGDYNQGIIIEQWVGPDDKNSSVNVIQLDQMTFGLPSREYFLKDSSERERKAYLKLMVEIATLYGAERETAEIDMSDVLDLEIRLANASTPEADRHDTGAIYNKMSLQELSEIVPEFDWVYYLNTFLPTKIDDQEPVVVYALPYLQEMGQIISQANRRTIHNYAIWRLIKHMIPFLDGEYSQKRTEFKKVLLGISAERERWNQCVDLVNKKMGMAVGALFIRDNFDPKSKETAQEMILNIREAFNELLEENAWMDKETREVARDKANAMNERIGYPDLLTNPVELSKEYEGLVIHDDLFLVNILNVFEFEAIKNLKKLRQPVNKDRWTTEPAVVNAFYNPNKNDIVFPAGILQPLFYSHYFPKSLNYGGIGVVIGHEMTHGFDDKGRQFDKEGNLKQWWNEATVRRFRERAQCIIDQYSSYVLEDIGLNINGKMTQGENIADNGGLKQAYRAYKKWVKRHGEEPLLPGLNLTHDQLFFLNYAQIWCGSMRPEDALSKVRSSVHSPGPIRVLGPLSNSYDFARTYNCPPGSRMNPSKKCSVW